MHLAFKGKKSLLIWPFGVDKCTSLGTTHLFFTDKLPIVNRDSGRRTLNNVVISDYIILYYTGCSRLKGKVSFFLTDLEVAWAGNTSVVKRFNLLWWFFATFISFRNANYLLHSIHNNHMNLVLAKVWKIKRICTTLLIILGAFFYLVQKKTVQRNYMKWWCKVKINDVFSNQMWIRGLIAVKMSCLNDEFNHDGKKVYDLPSWHFINSSDHSNVSGSIGIVG